MKRGKNAVFLFVLFLLCTFVLGLLAVFKNSEKVLEDMDQLFRNKAYSDKEYYFIGLLPFEYSEESKEANERAAAIGYEQAWQMTTEELSRLVNALHKDPSLHLLISGKDARNGMTEVYFEGLETFPEKQLTAYDLADDGIYQMAKQAYESSKNKPVTLHFAQITDGFADAAELPLSAGTYTDEEILYSEYLFTGKALPVVVGYDLRELFEIGGQYSVDFYGNGDLYVDEDGSLLKDVKKRIRYPKGNLVIEVTGILEPEATMLAAGVDILEDQPLENAILFPRFPLFDLEYSKLESEIDKKVYVSQIGNFSQLVILSDEDPGVAHEKIMQAVKECGMDKYIKDTSIHAGYLVAGQSRVAFADTVKKLIILGGAVTLLFLLISILRRVGNRLRYYSVHYLAGAGKEKLYFQTVAGIWLVEVLAATTVSLAIIMGKDRLEGTLFALYAEPVDLYRTIWTAAVLIMLFSGLVAAVRVLTADMTILLKEEK